MAVYERAAPVLAAQAGRAALLDAGWTPADVTHIVTVSCTGFAAPNFDVGLIRALELSRSVQRTHVGFMERQLLLHVLDIIKAKRRAEGRE